MVFTIEDTVERVQADGMETVVLGRDRLEKGYLRRSFASSAQARRQGHDVLPGRKGRGDGIACREAPDLIREMRLDGLLVDQIEPAGQAIAEHMGLPFVTIGNGLILNRESGLPPLFTGWQATRNPLKGRFYDLVGWLGDRTVDRTNDTLRGWRRKWGLEELPVADSFTHSRRCCRSCRSGSARFPTPTQATATALCRSAAGRRADA